MNIIMLRVQNHIILAWFPTYLPLVFFLLEKTHEMLSLTFFDHLLCQTTINRDKKGCTEVMRAKKIVLGYL